MSTGDDQSPDSNVDNVDAQPDQGTENVHSSDKPQSGHDVAEDQETPATDEVADMEYPEDHPLVRAFQAKKTALDETRQALNDMQETLTTAESDALRLRVGMRHGLSENQVELFLTGETDEAVLDARAAALVADRRRAPAPDPNQGRVVAEPPQSPGDKFAEHYKNRI